MNQILITNDKKDTVLIQVPDFDILSEGYGMVNAIEMAGDAIGLAGITREDMGKEIPNALDSKVASFSSYSLSITNSLVSSKAFSKEFIVDKS
mgnify:CR=1 FL=1